jgi:hypothetical protein
VSCIHWRRFRLASAGGGTGVQTMRNGAGDDWLRAAGGRIRNASDRES